MATCSKLVEANLDSDETSPSKLDDPKAAVTLTQAQLERIETNRKRALELRKSKQASENPAKM